MSAFTSVLSLVLQRMFLQILLGGGRKLDRVHDGVVDEAVDADESSQLAGVQLNVTANNLPTTPAAVPRGCFQRGCI